MRTHSGLMTMDEIKRYRSESLDTPPQPIRERVLRHEAELPHDHLYVIACEPTARGKRAHDLLPKAKARYQRRIRACKQPKTPTSRLVHPAGVKSVVVRELRPSSH